MQYTFYKTISDTQSLSCSKEELTNGLDKNFPKDMKKQVIDDCYRHFEDRKDREMNLEKFVDQVYRASLSITTNKVKTVVEENNRLYARDVRQDTVEESKSLSLDNEFSKIDKEHDAVLTFPQFDELLDKYDIKDIRVNMRSDLKSLLDPEKTNNITLAFIKEILDLPRAATEDGHFGLEMKKTMNKFQVFEDEEIEDNARKALKRIYKKDGMFDKIEKQITTYDHDKDGVVHRNILKQSIQDVEKEVHQDDIDYLAQFADKRSKGYFNPEYFMTNLVRVINDEAKKDTLFRKLNKAVRVKGIDLEKELNGFSKNNSGIIDTYGFMRAMRELRVGIDGSELDDLIKYASQGEKFIEIKKFIEMLEETANSKPITPIAPRSKKPEYSSKRNDISEKDQKKVHQKLKAITNQLIDAKRELENVEKNAQDWKAIAEKNEKALNILSDKLLDPNNKMKKIDELKAGGTSTKALKRQLKQQERILELDHQVEDLANRNEGLDKFIKVESKSQMAKYEQTAMDANKRLQSIRSENISLQSQIDKLVNASSTFEKNEEAEYARQMNIKNMEERIRELENNERDLNEECLRAEHKNLDMKFEKENNNLKLSRLNDKIKDLEDYIEIYTQLPPSMISKANSKGFDIHKEMANMPGASKRTASELEKVIEGLKRVINTQKAELEQNKKKDSKFSKNNEDKVSTNKLLKDEIQNLEKELKTVDAKDRDIVDLETKSHKLTEANRALNNDIKNEQKRYEFLEAKYKELLVKYNVTFKDLEKKQDSLFTMSTGANRATYHEYLTHKEELDKQKRER